MRTVTRTGTVVLAAGTLITTSPAFASAEAPRVAREGANRHDPAGDTPPTPRPWEIA